MTQLLQNINKLEYIDTRYLANILLLANDKVTLRYWRNFQTLPLVGLASMDVSQSIDNGSRLTTIKITAHSCADFPLVGSMHLAWRITTVQGDQYLVGTTEQPFPVVTVANDFPDKTTERSGITLNVSWRTPLDLLHIID